MSEPDDESYPRAFTRRGCATLVSATITVRRAPKSRPSLRSKSNLTNFQRSTTFAAPRKRNFEKRVTLPPGPIPGEFFEIAPLSRLIHPICSSSLCDLFLSSTASPKLVNIGHLRKKQV